MFPTAIATNGYSGGLGGSGSGYPVVAQKPSYLSRGAGLSSHLGSKRGAEDLDYFIGAEASAKPLPPGIIRVAVLPAGAAELCSSRVQGLGFNKRNS